jgi:hypothetical protein
VTKVFYLELKPSPCKTRAAVYETAQQPYTPPRDKRLDIHLPEFVEASPKSTLHMVTKIETGETTVSPEEPPSLN